MLILPLIGAGPVGVGLWRGLKANRLLAMGKPGRGRLVTSTPTMVKVGHRPVCKVTFEFEADDGQTYRASARTVRPQLLQDDAQEWLLYDPIEPSRAVMLDSLAGSPQIDARRELRGSLLRAVGASLVPGLAVLVHGSYAVLMYVL